MILAFSTSCAWTSVAAIDESSRSVVWSGRLLAPQSSSGACMKLLQQLGVETGIEPSQVDLFVADMGPGSFTGVRVGVTLAKTFGFLYSKEVAGVTSFDLIDASRTVVLPSRKGEFFVRRAGDVPYRTSEIEGEELVGFGPGMEPEVYPDASRVSLIIPNLVAVNAASFVPEYLIDPSISVPKKPFAPLGGKLG